MTGTIMGFFLFVFSVQVNLCE